MGAIRSAIAKELKRRKRTFYAFAKAMKDDGKLHSITIMKWLYSKKRISVETAEKMLAELDLVIVPRTIAARAIPMPDPPARPPGRLLKEAEIP